MKVRSYWGEPAPVIPHLLSTVLPGSGDYLTSGSYFEIPSFIRQVTGLITYTAAVGSLTARPVIRVSGGRAATTFLYPLVDEVAALDVVGQFGSRKVYSLRREWPSVVTAGTSVTIPITVDVVPGAHKLRFEVAELGAVLTPGTVSIGIMGS